MKLSIITINLNNKEGLRKTIESVVSQTFQDYEYIVIDGASTDGSVDVIKEYKDKITYWISEPDKGIYNAMNKGILQAKGEYCLFLNSGDWLVNDNTLLTRIFNQNFVEDIVYGNLIRVSKDKEVKREKYPDLLTMQFFYSYSLPHQASFIRRVLFNDALYDESYKIVSDWFFFVEKIIFKNCSYRHFDVFFANFDINGESSSNKVHLEERKKAMDLLLPKRIQEDYNTLVMYKNLKIKFLVDNYWGTEKGIKKIFSYLLIKSTIAYHLIFHKNSSS
jgi:Glycosyltransferases involved in cell wall biogenesis